MWPDLRLRQDNNNNNSRRNTTLTRITNLPPLPDGLLFSAPRRLSRPDKLGRRIWPPLLRLPIPTES